jgi:hypothetical protein
MGGIMSKGPGNRQRSIVAALKAAPTIVLLDLLGPHHTRSERVALLRAANTLRDKGVVGMLTYWDVATQTHVYVLHRPGFEAEAQTGLEWMYGLYWLRDKERA